MKNRIYGALLAALVLAPCLQGASVGSQGFFSSIWQAVASYYKPSQFQDSSAQGYSWLKGAMIAIPCIWFAYRYCFKVRKGKKDAAPEVDIGKVIPNYYDMLRKNGPLVMGGHLLAPSQVLQRPADVPTYPNVNGDDDSNQFRRITDEAVEWLGKEVSPALRQPLPPGASSAASSSSNVATLSAAPVLPNQSNNSQQSDVGAKPVPSSNLRINTSSTGNGREPSASRTISQSPLVPNSSLSDPNSLIPITIIDPNDVQSDYEIKRLDGEINRVDLEINRTWTNAFADDQIRDMLLNALDTEEDELRDGWVAPTEEEIKTNNSEQSKQRVASMQRIIDAHEQGQKEKDETCRQKLPSDQFNDLVALRGRLPKSALIGHAQKPIVGSASNGKIILRDVLENGALSELAPTANNIRATLAYLMHYSLSKRQTPFFTAITWQLIGCEKYFEWLRSSRNVQVAHGRVPAYKTSGNTFFGYGKDHWVIDMTVPPINGNREILFGIVPMEDSRDVGYLQLLQSGAVESILSPAVPEYILIMFEEIVQGCANKSLLLRNARRYGIWSMYNVVKEISNKLPHYADVCKVFLNHLDKKYDHPDIRRGNEVILNLKEIVYGEKTIKKNKAAQNNDVNDNNMPGLEDGDGD